ncbi:hypothetical protein DSM112329_04920 [Paraconexibacter sp. AEG42_29]|uniref:Uncharacterized protein n=1 Tax=Paraconexibacter sp. AEG42_29 TaxID=2997339 RepID=A0AAU7B2C8_9ACTN
MAETHDERPFPAAGDPVEDLRLASALTADTEAELLELRAAAIAVQRELAAIVLERAAIDAERVRLLEAVRLAEAATGDLRHTQNLERDAWHRRESGYHEELDALRDQARQAVAAEGADRDAWDAERLSLRGRISELEETTATLSARVDAETELRRHAEKWSVRHRAGVVAHKLPFVGRRRLSS